MNTYQVYIFDDDGNSIQLDTEGIDTKTVIALTDIEDLAARKSPYNSLELKGTKTNNQAFGSVFDLGRTTDFDNSIGIGFNYNSLRPVHCIILENSNLVFRGSLRLDEIVFDVNGQLVYRTALTSAFIDLKTAIQDKTLSDLDFSDMQHHYSNPTIVNSWSSSCEIYNTTTSAYTTSNFSFGKNYVYPMIDYGFFYTGATSVNEFYGRNFKCAVYTREYMNRIFDEAGFTYEIKASPEFNTLFDHLIVPDAQEKNRQVYSGFITKYAKPLIQVMQFYMANDGGPYNPADRLIPIQNVSYPPSNILPTRFLELYNPVAYQNVLSVRRGFNSASRVKMFISSQNIVANGSGVITYSIQIVKRPAEDNNLATSGWQVLGSKSVTLSLGQSYNDVIQVDASPTEFEEGDQVAVRIHADFTNPPNISVNFLLVDISSCELIVPPTVDDIIQIEVQPTLNNSDIVRPIPPVAIKQTDFLKSIINQFNFFVYSNNDNPKHIIFEKYDDFYALCQPQYIKNNSLDWTKKVDNTKGYKQQMNIRLPKSYLFTYKTDGDFLNDTYYKTFNEVYGSFSFADAYGLVDQKKVELIFSPTIVASQVGTDRVYPLIYKAERKPFKSNIRLIYYNGIRTCEPFTINNVEINGSSSTYLQYHTGSAYPQCSNYYERFDLLRGWVIDNDLHFFRPRQFYFHVTPDYLNAPNSYQNYYINEVSDLTNKDVKFFEANVMLSDIDMSSFDLHVPVFLKLGWLNESFFKVLSVDYDGSDSSSKVLLQKIGF